MLFNTSWTSIVYGAEERRLPRALCIILRTVPAVTPVPGRTARGRYLRPISSAAAAPRSGPADPIGPERVGPGGCGNRDSGPLGALGPRPSGNGLSGNGLGGCSLGARGGLGGDGLFLLLPRRGIGPGLIGN